MTFSNSDFEFEKGDFFPNSILTKSSAQRNYFPGSGVWVWRPKNEKARTFFLLSQTQTRKIGVRIPSICDNLMNKFKYCNYTNTHNCYFDNTYTLQGCFSWLIRCKMKPRMKLMFENSVNRLSEKIKSKELPLVKHVWFLKRWICVYFYNFDSWVVDLSSLFNYNMLIIVISVLYNSKLNR